MAHARFRLPVLLSFLVMASVAAIPAGSQAPSPTSPAARRTAQAAVAGARSAESAGLARIDQLVRDAIAAGQMPGAVVLVGRGDRTLYAKAFGSRAVEPAVEPMTLDTVFDMASVTKVVATATSVMALVDEGRLRLTDRVAAHVPGFGRYGKEAITIRHLLTHVSGLRPDVDVSDEWVGYDEAIRRAVEEVPTAPPGERFVYSDINYFLLGHIVGTIAGAPLDQYARSRVFEPAGMKDTMFNPPASMAGRVAPTERCTTAGPPCGAGGSTVLRGVVHDPTARRMGGVAGHAGLFSTAADMALYCRMILNGGSIAGRRILSPLAVAKMTSPATPPGATAVRGIGWDIDTSYSSNRGELLPVGSFGHTGFTGTSVWIDPVSRLYVVILSNRVHPDGKGDAVPLRARIATVAAASLADPAPPDALRTMRMTGGDFSAPTGSSGGPGRVMTGIDVLAAEQYARIQGKRIGLLTNHTGLARGGRSTIDLLHQAKGVQLVALFSPEHGIRGTLDETFASSTDEKTGLPIHSLYGKTMRPTDEMLAGIDLLVVDIQDIGARFYTYITAVGYVMEEAARRKIAVMVLDRPNPVGGWIIEGPVNDKALTAYVAYLPMPIRHGLTLGELARFFNAENRIGADLTVVEMKGWSRSMWFDETGLMWVNPSPNMRNQVQAMLYPGIGAIEGSNISVGRGTDTPFEQIGAPWIDGEQLAETLNARRIPGVSFYPLTFTPTASKYAKEVCQGVFMVVTDRASLKPVRVGFEIASALCRLYPSQYKLESSEILIGSKSVIARLKAGDDPAAVVASLAAEEARWRLKRAPFLLYR